MQWRPPELDRMGGVEVIIRLDPAAIIRAGCRGQDIGCVMCLCVKHDANSSLA